MEKGKHLFFDLDGTITESRQVISPKMKKKLLKLDPFVVISGGESKRILKQMDGVPCTVMGQQGNEAPDWKNKLTVDEVAEILGHIEKICDLEGLPLDKETTHNRGCQVSFSFTGHDASIEWKRLFDPSQEYRKYILKKVPFKSRTMEVRIAGTTCLDYNKKKHLKGDNLKRYMKLHRLNPKDCVYYGDNFDPDGNDRSVLGVMQCIKVDGPEDLYKKL